MKKIFLLLLVLLNTCYMFSQKPNIVWIVSEDNSPFLGCYGDKIAKTPSIDKLASEGILFNNAFSNAPVCAPSRATLITGMYPTALGTQHMRSDVKLPDDVKFFPKYLKDEGYYTTLRLKRDYNSPNQEGTWDKDDFWHLEDALTDKGEEQPFFMFYNTWTTHESILTDYERLNDGFRNTFENDKDIEAIIASFPETNPNDVTLPAYHPDTKEGRTDLAFYYKAIQMMDYEVGRIVKFLTDKNLIENTIIIYSSDHGGVLGRSKRFDYESGLKVPMIIRFPEKYKNLIASNTIGKTNRIVSFLDMAPTILSLAGIEKPENMHGSAFMGTYEKAEDTIAYGFRGRMDEAYDMVRTVRDKKYRYIRNYMHYLPNGQHIAFLWGAKSMQAWEKLYQEGVLNSTQKAFFEPRFPEELYDIENDPDNINNLANNSEYASELEQLRNVNRQIIHENFDSGFFPEGELWERSKQGELPYTEVINNCKKEWKMAANAADKATLQPTVKGVKSMLNSKYSTVRFWGATGSVILGDEAISLKNNLLPLLNDESDDVRVVSAEALYLLNEKEFAIKALLEVLNKGNLYVKLRALNVISNRKIKDKRVLNKIETLDTSNKYMDKICTYILNK